MIQVHFKKPSKVIQETSARILMKTVAISTKNDRGTKSTGGTLVGMPLCAAGVREGIQPLLWGQREEGLKQLLRTWRRSCLLG